MKIITANIALLTLFIAASCSCYGQNDDSTVKATNRYSKVFKSYKNAEVLIGINWQGNLKDEVSTLRYAEVGIARSIHHDGMHGPASFGVYLSEEVYFGSNNIYGTKIGVYTHYLFDLGLSMIYYTDFKKGNFKVRPEFGIGMGGFRVVTGINIPTINNRDFERLRKNNIQVAIQVFVRVKKKMVKQEGNIFRNLFKKEQNGSSKNYLGRR